MAKNDFNPTAANIISSLGVKGASTTGGTGQEGKVPVIGSDGLLDISLIPLTKIYAEIEVPPIENAVYVDPEAGSQENDYTPNGSIVAPFRTLDAAAAAGYSNFVLVSGASGSYGVSSPVFTTTDTVIRIFSTGMAQFVSLSLNGYLPGTTFILNNISVDSFLSFNAASSCRVLLTGIGSTGTLKGAIDNPDDPDVSTWYLSEAALGPSYAVTNFKYVAAISYLAKSGQITNTSAKTKGNTVSDALDSLSIRRIRIPKFTADSTGIRIASTEDVKTTDGTAYDFHNVSELGSTLVAAANSTFYKKGDSPEFNHVEANIVEASSVDTSGLATTKIKFGTVPVYIDEEDFLVIGDTDSSESHAYPRYDDADDTEYPKRSLDDTSSSC